MRSSGDSSRAWQSPIGWESWGSAVDHRPPAPRRTTARSVTGGPAKGVLCPPPPASHGSSGIVGGKVPANGDRAIRRRRRRRVHGGLELSTRIHTFHRTISALGLTARASRTTMRASCCCSSGSDRCSSSCVRAIKWRSARRAAELTRPSNSGPRSATAAISAATAEAI